MILMFLLFVVVVIPVFTLGMAFIWEIIKFLGMLVTVVVMFAVEFFVKPIYNGLKKLFCKVKLRRQLLKGSE